MNESGVFNVTEEICYTNMDTLKNGINDIDLFRINFDRETALFKKIEKQIRKEA